MSDFAFVRSARDLQAGDHISWPTYSKLSHHVIVVKATGYGSEFKVIHVVGDMYSPASASEVSCAALGFDRLGWVCEQTIDLDEPIRNSNLRRYNYPSGECNPPAKVIKNARSKLGMFNYNALYNNCEHFAQWCKTGNRISYQAFTFAIIMLILAVALGVYSLYSK